MNTMGKRAGPRQGQPGRTAQRRIETDMAAGTASPLRKRRRPLSVVIGILLIALSGLGSYLVLTSAAQTRQILVTTRHLSIGEAITITDLTTIEVAGAQHVAGLPSEQLETVAGQFTRLELPRGAFITADSIARERELPAGQAIVGIALGVEQLPGETVRPGAPVRIVAPPEGTAPTGGEGIPTIDATVRGVHSDERSGLTIVDLRVAAETAPQLAAWAATGRIALILDTAGG